ncbi:MAG: 4-oxalomesaconate tautomerase [Pseudomonadota bacterium]
MTQTAIPFLFIRGGTSRGPYMQRPDLPEDRETLAKVLISAIGAGHPLNIDGIGGGAPVTTKVAMISRSDQPGVDIDYLFAQVSVTEKMVDFKPTCGNMLSGVGPAAIELGLAHATPGETRLRIRAVNTGALIDATLQTPGGAMTYEGDAAIDGVPGTAAPVGLSFMGVVGAATGKLLPTGAVRDTIDGIEVTCLDVAMPVVIARAEAFGLTGHESSAELDADKAFFARMEPIRIEASRRMGMGDVSQSVTPKFALVAPARSGGSLATRYFQPWNCHPTLAVTGAQCIASCALMPGTVADGLMAPPESPAKVVIEHPLGAIDALVDFKVTNAGIEIHSAGLTRTTRLLARGELYVPRSVWAG